MQNAIMNTNSNFSKDSNSQNIPNPNPIQSLSKQTQIRQTDELISTQLSHETQSPESQQQNQQHQPHFPNNLQSEQQTEPYQIQNSQSSQQICQTQPSQSIQSQQTLQAIQNSQQPSQPIQLHQSLQTIQNSEQPSQSIQSQQSLPTIQNSQQNQTNQQFNPQITQQFQQQPFYQAQTNPFQSQPMQFLQPTQQQQQGSHLQMMQPFQYQQPMAMQQPQTFQMMQAMQPQQSQTQSVNQIQQSQTNQTQQQPIQMMQPFQTQPSYQIQQPQMMQSFQKTQSFQQQKDEQNPKSQENQQNHFQQIQSENQVNSIQPQQSQEQMQAYQYQQIPMTPICLQSKKKQKKLIQQYYQQMHQFQPNYYYNQQTMQMQPFYQQFNNDQIQSEQKQEDQPEKEETIQENLSDNDNNRSDQNQQQNELENESNNQKNHSDNEKSEQNTEDNIQSDQEQEEKSETEKEQKEKSENESEKEKEKEKKSESENESEKEKEKEKEEKSENENEKEEEEPFKLIHTYQTNKSFFRPNMFYQQYPMQQHYMQSNQSYPQQMQTQYFNQTMQPFYYPNYPNQMYQYYPNSNYFYQNNLNANSNGYSTTSSQLETSSPQFLEKIISDPENEQETSANYEFELFKEIDGYYNTLHNSPIICSHGMIEFNEDKLSFEKEIESKFINTIKLLATKFDKSSIQSIDDNIENISARKSGSITKRKCISTIYDNQNSNENEKEISNFILKSKINVTLFVKVSNMRRHHLNEKLLSFYLSEFIDSSTCSYKIENVEVSTFVSYILKLNSSSTHLSIISSPNNTYFNTNNEFIVNQPVYVYFSKEQGKHILNFYGIEVDTQFIFPAKSIFFYRDSNINKLYIRGDIRVKEYTINGLDEYIQSACEEMNQNTVNHPIEWNKDFDPDNEIKKKTISIVESNTFFYEEFEYKKSVITIWDDELVLGCNSSLVFWEVDNSNEENKNQSNLQIENIQTITSLSVLKQSSTDSYLAVASDVYPIIFIFNKEHQNVSRLISHTMGITSLCSYNFSLFSGSFDQTARVWDLNKDMPTALYNMKSYKITAIETGTFCDKLFLFIGTNNHSIFVISCTHKKILYEIALSEKAVPIKIAFFSASNKDKGDYCKLMVISECEDSALQNIFNTIQVQYFVFA